MTDAAVHPQLRRLARVVPRRGVGPRNLRPVRALARLVGPPLSRGVTTTTLDDGTRIRLHRPAGVTEPTPALLWLHGGGYVLGTARQDDRLCRRFAEELGATVAAVDYRFAPEHPYPAALDDAYAGLRWLASLPGVDPTRVAVGGASAGGGLAAALALRAHDRGEHPLVLQLLAYPMLDDRSAASPPDPRYRLWTPASNRFGWSCYLGDTDPATAVPARRGPLAGVAPAWIGVGTHDLFYAENLTYAERLIAAAVDCHLEVVPGAFHGFDLLAPAKSVSRAFFASQCARLRAAFTVRNRGR
ncbi:alpha/beta hydrolase [Mycolicibacillus koreensis]|nr:alpha/beta hydrolase [Mycolicibacillus koreensis]